MKQKKPSTIVEGFVLEAGIEPALQRNWILNPARLPVPPLEHIAVDILTFYFLIL